MENEHPNDALKNKAKDGRKKRKLFRWAVVLLMILALGVCLEGLGMRRHRIVKTWDQPEHVEHDGRTYYLTVAESKPYLPTVSSLLFSGMKKYFIFIGKEEKPSYGHFIDFTFHYGGDDEAVKSSTVDWQENGITLTTPSGHVLFIPQESFTGGR